jgi:hypothetical protein
MLYDLHEHDGGSEVSDFNSILKWMVTREDFIQVKVVYFYDLGIVMFHCG